MMASGMEVGVNEGYEKLDELLERGWHEAARRRAPAGGRRLHRPGARRHRLGRAGAGRRAGPRATSYAISSSGSRRSSRAAPGVRLAAGPSVDDDPVAAWQAHSRRGAGAARRPGDRRPGADQPAHRRGPARPRRSTGSTPPTSSCTPGTWPAPPARTRRSTPRTCAVMLAGMEPMDEVLPRQRAVRRRGRRCRRRRRADPADRLHRARPGLAGALGAWTRLGWPA